MKNIIFLILLGVVLSAAVSFAEEAAKDPQSDFYNANSLYEKGEYEKACDEYLKALNSGIESGALYYNLGNTYFKMGKTGRAIAAYKKAAKIIPGDSDLKSNLSYVQSLTEDSGLQPPVQNRLAWLIRIPFRELNLNLVSIILMALYLVLISFMVLGMIYPAFKQRATFFFYVFLIMFIITLSGFCVRYYNEEIIRHGIVVAKEADCKYEPIEKSTTYFTLKEGQDVQVLETRNGWRRIKRLDGKLGWVPADTVEEID